jgi:hypothetical protein
MTRLRSLAGKAATAWFHYASFKLGVFVGWIGGMLTMAVVITAVFTAPDAVELLTRQALP